MLRAFRQIRGLAVFALLVMVGSIPVATAALIHDADDTICEPLFVAHDETAHRIGAARTLESAPEHCAICHCLQSLQAPASDASVAAPVCAFAHLASSPSSSAGAAAVSQLAARAPPLA